MGIAAFVVAFILGTGFGLTRPTPAGDHESAETKEHSNDGAAESVTPPSLAVLPFALLLGFIATFPLIPQAAHWWEHNQNKLLVAVGLALITLAYYFLRPAEGGASAVTHVLEHAILADYIPFIILLFSLYTICGGIRISGDIAAHPYSNVVFMVVGSLLASFIGTTGAAMLLIRPLLETNQERKHVAHTVVFFIFSVCNCGGLLLPLGDPPLFLGYLRGVPFMWTAQHLWLPWIISNTLIISVYYLIDHFYWYPRETAADIARDEAQIKPIRLEGLWPNVLLLAGVILSVAFLDANQTVPGTTWRPPVYLREAVQLTLVAVSLLVGSARVRQENKFNYGAIIEVAALFVGIFITMHPALEILKASHGHLGIIAVDHPFRFFWASGTLSSVLDNAPTYAVFFDAAAGQFNVKFADLIAGHAGTPEEIDRALHMLMGISLGSVCMGAMTYIGNGPNFMARTIAEQSGVKMPSFFGYVFKYSVPVLLPIFFLINWLFLR